MLRSIMVVAVSLLLSTGAIAERLKDISTVAGVRSNQLVGYGLVVGLGISSIRCKSMLYQELMKLN